MDVQNYSLSYNQMGVVATLELDDEQTSGNKIAFQRFLPDGPVALLPLSDNLSSLVWTTNVSRAKELLKLEDDEFVQALNEALSKKHSMYGKSFLDNIQSIFNIRQSAKINPPQIKKVFKHSRAAFPLGFGHTASYVKQGVVLIGDAAHRIHPLAGQGVNLGFGDVLKLTEVLSEAIYNGSNIEDIQYLLKYEREQLRINLPIMLGVHALQKLYCNDFPPFVIARNIGLQLTDSNLALKNILMKKAMG
jgi:ubiquinone biosynthesis monooxygenase Coq6